MTSIGPKRASARSRSAARRELGIADAREALLQGQRGDAVPQQEQPGRTAEVRIPGDLGLRCGGGRLVVEGWHLRALA